MAEPLTTDPEAAGHQTSEFKVFIVMQVIGAALETVAGVLHTLHDAMPNAAWVNIAMIAVGALVQLMSAMKYMGGRVELKKAILTNQQVIEDLQKGPKE